MLWYLIKLPIKFYVVTWTYVLILCGKNIPKWLQEEVKEEIKVEIPLGKPEPYQK